jgi:hypothetical protein
MNMESKCTVFMATGSPHFLSTNQAPMQRWVFHEPGTPARSRKFEPDDLEAIAAPVLKHLKLIAAHERQALLFPARLHAQE